MTLSTRAIRRTVAYLALSMSSFWLTSASAQNVGAPKIVKDVEVEYVGARSVSPDRILSNMSLKPGSPFSQAALENDIKNLYQSGLVENIRILSESVGSDGVRIIAVVETRASLGGISFVGNSMLSERSLESKVELEVGDPIDEAKVQEGQRSIRTLYTNRGFTEASVTYQIVTEADGVSQLIYTIDEGMKSELRDVEFVGNSVFTSRELRGLMKSKPKTILSILTKSGRLDSDQLEDDLDGIERHYRNAGYLNAEVVDVRRVRADDSRVDLVLTIDEGVLYSVNSVDISGARVFSEADLFELLSTKAGENFSAAKIEADIEALEAKYGRDGYAEVRVVPQLDSAGGTTVDVAYLISEGGQFYVGQVNIEGNVKTRDDVIRNELAIVPGEVLSTPRIRASQRRLQNTGYFGSVDILPSDTSNPEFKDVNIRVEEKPTGSLNFGAGFSSIDNFVGFVEVTQTNFDLGNWPSMTGGGQRFRAAARVGTERRDFSFSLTEPWFTGRRLALTTEAYYRDQFFLSDDYDQTNWGGAVSLRKRLAEFVQGSVEYRYEGIELSNLAPEASPEVAAEIGDYRRSAVGFNIVRDARDDLFLTRRGNRTNLGVTYSGLGGDLDHTHFELGTTQFFQGAGDSIFTLIGNFQSVSGSDVPIFDRLYLGGANNLRGFDFRDVGPRDSRGEVIGGQTSAFMTAEVTVPIVEQVRGALFYDMGIVDDDEFSLDGDWMSDWGVGLRLFLPIGPLRLDYAFPIETDEFNDDSGRFNFNIGYRF